MTVGFSSITPNYNSAPKFGRQATPEETARVMPYITQAFKADPNNTFIFIEENGGLFSELKEAAQNEIDQAKLIKKRHKEGLPTNFVDIRTGLETPKDWKELKLETGMLGQEYKPLASNTAMVYKPDTEIEIPQSTPIAGKVVDLNALPPLENHQLAVTNNTPNPNIVPYPHTTHHVPSNSNPFAVAALK